MPVWYRQEAHSTLLLISTFYDRRKSLVSDSLLLFFVSSLSSNQMCDGLSFSEVLAKFIAFISKGQQPSSGNHIYETLY